MCSQLKLIEGYEEQSSKLMRGIYQRFKYNNNYRKATDNNCCKNCLNRVFFACGNKKYYKCSLMGISHSANSDIRLSYVCDLWKEV